MKHKNILLSLVISILIFSCIQKKKKAEEENFENKKVTEMPVTVIKNNSLLDIDIDVQKIKHQLDGVTTTFLQNEDAIIFPDRKKNNFYGYYTLIKNDEEGTATRIVGNMIIYDSINPYKYDKNTDEFVEITLEQEGISVFDEKIEVGVTKYSTLIKEFGNDYQTRNSTLIFSKNNKIAFFKVEDSLVSKIKIGVYRDNDIDKILKISQW